MSDTTIRVEPRTAAVGADVRGIDLRTPLTEAERAAIHQGLLDHVVLFFGDQHLDLEQHLRVSGELGQLNPSHPARGTGLEDHPEIYVPVTRGIDTDGGHWHADHSYMPEPSAIGIMRAIDVPDVGGDTQWSSLISAYERLSPPFRRLVDGLSAVHDPPADWHRRLAEHGPGTWNGRPVESFATVVHPLVLVHPISGRRALLLPNRTGEARILDVSARESDALLTLLYRHLAQPEHVVRFRWTPGAVAIWDNRVSVHYAVGDFAPGTRRLLHRTSLWGERVRGSQDAPGGDARPAAAGFEPVPARG